MTFYIQLNLDKIITDCITYPYGDYQQVEMETPLPDGLIGGWYRWDGFKPVKDEELYAAAMKEIEEAEAERRAQEEASE